MSIILIWIPRRRCNCWQNVYIVKHFKCVYNHKPFTDCLYLPINTKYKQIKKNCNFNFYICQNLALKLVTCNESHEFWIIGWSVNEFYFRHTLCCVLSAPHHFACPSLSLSIFLSLSVLFSCFLSSALDQWLPPTKPFLLTFQCSQGNRTLVRKESSSKLSPAYK